MEGFGPGAKIVIPIMSISATTFIPLTSAADINPATGSLGKSLPGGNAIAIVLPPRDATKIADANRRPSLCWKGYNRGEAREPPVAMGRNTEGGRTGFKIHLSWYGSIRPYAVYGF